MKRMKRRMILSLPLSIGLLLGGCSEPASEGATNNASEMGDRASREREILYWVAPMDPTFKRDKPGKSPMGMDLVPVYADEAGGGDKVEIDPVVVQNLGVRTAKAERGKLWRRIDTVGYVDYDERHISHIHLRTDGWIDKLYVKSEGERVEKGDVLFEVYSRELVNAQEEYLQALNAGNASLRQASRERLQALGMGEEQIRELSRTRKVDQLVRYHAKQDGIVDRLRIREGMYVQPQTEVMTLADLSSVWLLVDVFERQADWVEVGQPAEVKLPYLPGRVWEGEVEFIYPSIDPKTRTLQVRLRFDNPKHVLKPDMYAEVTIYAEPRENVLMIPREALIRTGQSERVILALGDGRFTAQEVVSGMESGDWVEIKRGLEAGDRIVTSGQFLLDSEASLKGALNRLDAGKGGQQEMQMESPPTREEQQTQEKHSVMGMGTVKAVLSGEHKLNIAHEPIEALDWPAMTMDFAVSKDVDLGKVTAGDQVHFILKQGKDERYRITELQVMKAE